MRKRVILAGGLIAISAGLMVFLTLKHRGGGDAAGLLDEDPAVRSRVAAELRAEGADPVFELLRLASPRLGPYPGCAEAGEDSVRAARLLVEQVPEELHAAVLAGLHLGDYLIAHAALTLIELGRVPLDARVFWAAVAAAREPDLRDPLRRALHESRYVIPMLLAESPESEVDPDGVGIAVRAARLPLSAPERERLMAVVASGAKSAHAHACRSLLEADQRTGALGR